MSETSVDTVVSFSGWRKILWPIRSIELKAFLPLFILKFCVSFNYTVLAATKDTVVVTAKGSGAEVIPVLKGGVVLVIAFCVMLVYSKLSNRLSRDNLFYTILFIFSVFFLLYGFVLFPYRELLSPNQSADWLLSIVGTQHKHWICVYRDWMNSLFFVLAELWGGVMISILFWGFANQITNVKNAMRFYVLYSAGGQIGTIIAGTIIYYYSNITVGDFSTTVSGLMSIILFVCMLIAIVYWWTNNYVVNIKIDNNKDTKNQEQLSDNLTKLSLKDSLFFIMRSPYLGLIALMVIGYGISVNMVEVSWKAMLKLQFPDPSGYQAYMGIVQTILGFISLFVAVFVGGNIIRNYGWYTSAKLTPIVLGITSFLFFIVYFIFPNYASNHVTLCQWNIPIINFKFLITPLGLLVAFGTIHNIACKTMKYCLFDTTKEMAYIPLDKEAKIKGKAAVDLVGARFGKSGASWTQLALIDFIGAGSILEVLYLLCPCIGFILIFWFFAVKGLNKRFIKLQAENSMYI